MAVWPISLRKFSMSIEKLKKRLKIIVFQHGRNNKPRRTQQSAVSVITAAYVDGVMPSDASQLATLTTLAISTQPV